MHQIVIVQHCVSSCVGRRASQASGVDAEQVTGAILQEVEQLDLAHIAETLSDVARFAVKPTRSHLNQKELVFVVVARLSARQREQRIEHGVEQLIVKVLISLGRRFEFA